MTVSVAKDILKEYYKINDEQVESLVKYDLPNDCDIRDLDFSIRTYNCLKRVNIDKLSELIQKTETDMMKVRNMGRKSLKEIKNKLASIGLSLKEEE